MAHLTDVPTEKLRDSYDAALVIGTSQIHGQATIAHDDGTVTSHLLMELEAELVARGRVD